MKLFLLCCLLLPAVPSTQVWAHSMVITSRDVASDGFNTSVLLTGRPYRVYAVYARSAPNNIYAKQILLQDGDKRSISLAALADENLTRSIFLSDKNILFAPITIIDPKLTNGMFTYPYTIYIVSEYYPPTPVVSAQYSDEYVDSSYANLTSAGCTVLSAEPAFQISKIYTKSFDEPTASLEVLTGGYDAHSMFNVMTLTKSNYGSLLVVNGPIATIWNIGGKDTDFQFTLAQKGEHHWTTSLTPGVSTAFLSNGWLSVDESFNVDYPTRALIYQSRNYDYGRETEISFQSSTSENSRENEVQLFCYNKAETLNFFLSDNSTSSNIWCESLSLYYRKTSANEPRFLIQIQSSAAEKELGQSDPGPSNVRPKKSSNAFSVLNIFLVNVALLIVTLNL